MKDPKIHFDYDTSGFRKNASQVVEDVKKETVDIVRYCANVFANAAARYTPPNMGKSSLKLKDWYYRPYFIIKRLIRGGYHGFTATKDDIDQLKKRNGIQGDEEDRRTA